MIQNKNIIFLGLTFIFIVGAQKSFSNIVSPQDQIQIQIEFKSKNNSVRKVQTIIYSQQFFARYGQLIKINLKLPLSQQTIETGTITILGRLTKNDKQIFKSTNNNLSINIVCFEQNDILLFFEQSNYILKRQTKILSQRIIFIQYNEKELHHQNKKFLVKRIFDKFNYFPFVQFSHYLMPKNYHKNIEKINKKYQLEVSFALVTQNSFQKFYIIQKYYQIFFQIVQFFNNTSMRDNKSRFKEYLSFYLRNLEQKQFLKVIQTIRKQSQFLIYLVLYKIQNFIQLTKDSILTNNSFKLYFTCFLLLFSFFFASISSCMRFFNQRNLWMHLNDNAAISLSRPILQIWMNLLSILVQFLSNITLTFGIMLNSFLVILYSLWKITKRVNISSTGISLKPSYQKYAIYDLQCIAFLTLFIIFLASVVNFFRQQNSLYFKNLLVLINIYFTIIEFIPQIYINIKLNTAGHMKSSLLILRLLMAFSDNYNLMYGQKYLLSSFVFYLREEILIIWLLYQKATMDQNKTKQE